MNIKKEIIENQLKTIQSLLEEALDSQGRFFRTKLDQAAFSMLSIIQLLYGGNSEYKNQILLAKAQYLKSGNHKDDATPLKNTIEGVLYAIKFEIENNLLQTLDTQSKGEILGDFISLAKQLLNEDYKDAAAVLSCGALEDLMKKFADKVGLNVADEDLSSIINLLKSKSYIKGAQSGVVQSYVQLRNKAFHAQFDKIQSPEVASLISFVEQFLIENF